MDHVVNPSFAVLGGSQPSLTIADSSLSLHTSYPENEKSLQSRLYEESIINKNKQVSLSAFAFLFSEIVLQQRESSKTVSEVESKLSSYGYSIGVRLIELLSFRDSVLSRFSHLDNIESLSPYITSLKKRPIKILDILQFIHSTLWKYLFSKISDDLVKSSERENEYMIVDNEPQWTQFIHGSLIQCEAFTGGIIEGVADHAGFPCHVTVHSDPEGRFDRRVVYLIKFSKQVIEREALRL